MIAGARWVNRSAAKGAGGVAVRIHGDVLKLDIMIMVNVD
jgi:predicted trehalose synthase